MLFQTSVLHFETIVTDKYIATVVDGYVVGFLRLMFRIKSVLGKFYGNVSTPFTHICYELFTLN